MTYYTPGQQAEHRHEWVQALRSDDYEQGQRALRDDDDHYCCLGVACDISELSEWDGGDYLNQGGDLPDEVMDWLGLATPEGTYFWRDRGLTRHTLAELNDNGFTFNEIADIIEREPDGLLA